MIQGQHSFVPSPGASWALAQPLGSQTQPGLGKTAHPRAEHSQHRFQQAGLLRDIEEGQATPRADGTFKSRGTRRLPRVFVFITSVGTEIKEERREKTEKIIPSKQLPEAP